MEEAYYDYILGEGSDPAVVLAAEQWRLLILGETSHEQEPLHDDAVQSDSPQSLAPVPVHSAPISTGNSGLDLIVMSEPSAREASVSSTSTAPVDLISLQLEVLGAAPYVECPLAQPAVRPSTESASVAVSLD